MPKCRPSKWVPWAVAGAGLPFLGAWWLSSASLETDIATRAKAALDAAETTKWATVVADGRDVTVSGESMTQAAIDDAAKAVAGTYGVRRVDVSGATLAALPPPTVESITTASTTPEIKGTWAEGVATTLAVTVAGATYKLGESPELTSNAGNWLLKLSQPLPEGQAEATVEQSDGGARTAAAAEPAKIVVDTTPPALPVPEIPQASWPYAITGTWGEEPGATLQADVAGRSYVLGKDPALTSDGKGTYSFAPTDVIEPGSHDLKLTTTDALGNVTTTVVPAAVVVPAPEVAAPVPEPGVPVAVSAVSPPADAVWPYAITGTWAEAPGSKLRARLAGRTYELGRGAALTSDGAGTFTFAPAAKNLQPGTYTIWFTAENAQGVKAVTSTNIVVPEPVAAQAPQPEPAPAPAPELPAPTVEKQLALTGAPIIKGTWPEGQATSLTVTVADRSYVLGTDANLSSRAGAWSLFPAAALKDGIYDVVVDVAGADGATKRDATVAELEVDGEPPAAPAVTAYSGEASPPSVAGTWDEKQAVGGLTVAMPGINLMAKLGEPGSPLTSDGGGAWTLALNQQLPPGTYEVEVTSTDAHGRQQADATTGEVVITAPPAPAPEPAPATAAVLDAVDLAEGVTYPTAITGTWPEGVATNLKARFAGRTYELGRGAALTSDGEGTFTFAPSAKLDPGSYTAWFTSKMPSGEVLVDKVDVTVPAPVVAEAPPAPEPAPAPAPAPAAVLDAVDLAEGVTYPTAITGSWPEGVATNLKARFAGRTYELGRGAALTSDGKGTFTFAPSAKLDPGSYTAWFTSKMPSGEVLVDKVDVTVPAPVVAEAPPAPEPAPAPAPAMVPERPFDCVMVLGRLNQVFPIRFEFDMSEIQGVSALSLAQYAALLKDNRCASLNVEIGGHADFKGSEAYNQALSERRANAVLAALQEAGIDVSRMTPKGYSELVPLDPATTDEARMKNRRVEITVNSN